MGEFGIGVAQMFGEFGVECVFGKFGMNVNLFNEFILNESKEINSKLLTFFMFGSLTFCV